MSDTPNTGYELHNAILASPGMAHVNRAHYRTFSFNIFRMNAQELIEIARRVNDPDEGLRLMVITNRDASQQTHREVSRRVHNFAAAALTLVEHTRSFMREHYADTSVFKKYQDKIDAEFLGDPVARFVQDLRNYMLHKGLPESAMYMTYKSNPDAPNGGGDMQTGIKFNSASLLEWKKWSDPARAFIIGSGDDIEISSFAEPYTKKATAFHDWLQNELELVHADELKEMQRLQLALAEYEVSQRPISPATEIVEAIADKSAPAEESFCFHSERAQELDAAAAALLAKVRKIELTQAPRDGFASERPVGATITDNEMIEDPLFWGNDVEGNRVFVFIYNENGTFGLDESSFAELRIIVESILKTSWASKMLGRAFLESTIIDWLQATFGMTEPSGFSAFLSIEAKKAVQHLTLWAPIAHLEVEESFPMGPAEIVPISKAMLDELEELHVTARPEQREDILALFADLRKRMQGFAAVVVKIESEVDKIQEDGNIIAKAVIGLLRFFHPASYSFPAVSATALLGTEIVPSSNLMVLGDGTFSFRQSNLAPNMPGWRISKADLSRLKQSGLEAVSSLVRPDTLSPFAFAVRSGILLFGDGTTFPDQSDRISYALSALEMILLGHSAEPVEFTLGERMSLLLREVSERDEVRRLVREAYRLRARRSLSSLAPHELASVTSFIRFSYQVIHIAKDNLNRYRTVTQFVASIDRIENSN